MQDRQCRTGDRDNARPCREGKGVKGLLLVDHGKVPCGFGLRTGDRGNAADVVLGTAGGLPAKHRLLTGTGSYQGHGLLLFLPEILYP